MVQPRYLTKSKFKLGMQCPTKLYYVDKRETYANSSFDDPFLKQLAIGGFQVGELARQYYRGGEHVLTQNYQTAVEITDELLKREKVTIYEAAFRHKNFFIRADILVKDGENVDLIEVKAKSCDFDTEESFKTKPTKTKPAGILEKWRDAIEDVAFQKYVINLARPDLNVTAHLMLADKTVVAATDGLNQKFRAAFDTTGTRYIDVRGTITDEDLSVNLLRTINVDGCCDIVYGETYETLTFDAHASMLADYYARDVKLPASPSAVCKECEFRRKDTQNELLCGYRECWTETLNFQPVDFEEPNILEVWKLDKRKFPYLLKNQKIKFSQLAYEDVSPKTSSSPHIDARRWRQIDKWQKSDTSPYVDREGLAAEMAKWKYPLHFIDFETAMPVIPFKAGRRPYEGIAFQFSHHVVEDEDAQVICHTGQFLETRPGVFPNYDFVRELKRQLENDAGSIFRYHSHENSFLCTIREQLIRDSAHIEDRDELVTFIETIAKPRNDHAIDDWITPERNMIDLYDLVVRYYFDPAMGGSNSIKKVLPAALNSSERLKAKYSQAIYGGAGPIPSLNFTEGHTWVAFDTSDKVVDPYHSLSGVFDGVDWTQNDYNVLIGGIDDVSDGGAAMAAYGKLQYEDMSSLERDRLNAALLKYCELDTLAMVMIYEAWRAAL